MYLMHNPLTINLIGAGKLGKSIAYLLHHRAGVIIQGIYSKTSASAASAAAFIGAGTPFTHLAALPPAQLWLITTTDEAISSVAKELSHHPGIRDSAAIHFSGSIAAAALEPLANKAMATASVHPMYSFAQPYQVIEDYQDVYCAIEGNKELLPGLFKLFKTIGSIPYEIDGSQKSVYHAAGVFASNYLITLADSALTCLNNAQVPQAIAADLTLKLMRNTLNNIENTPSLIDALTGPLQRGDSKTITSHLHALPQRLVELYQTLGKNTLSLTPHCEEKKQQLALLLDTHE